MLRHRRLRGFKLFVCNFVLSLKEPSVDIFSMALRQPNLVDRAVVLFAERCIKAATRLHTEVNIIAPVLGSVYERTVVREE